MRTPGQQPSESSGSEAGADIETAAAWIPRIKSEDLFHQQHEVEIEHQGRIYRLRRTQLNKLILTA